MTDYKVSVALALESAGFISALSAISARLLGVERHVGAIHRGIKGWNTALIAVGTALATGVIAKGFMTIANAAKPLLNQQDQLVRAGVSLNEVLKLQGDFYTNIAKKIPTAEASEYLNAYKEMRSVTGPGPEGSKAAAALAQKSLMIDALLANTFGERAETGEYYKLLRSAEMKGVATDPKKLEQLTDLAFSYITAFGGKLTGRDIQTMARMGGAAWMHMDPVKAFGPMAVLAADIGGAKAGTAMMSLYQFQQGAATISRQQGQMLRQLGLLDMSKVKMTGFGGGRMQLEPGALAGSLKYSEDLPGWVKDVISPAAHKWAAGQAAAGKGEESALYEAVMQKLMPNRNVARLGMMFSDPGFLDQIRKDLGLAGQVLPIPEAYKRFTEVNPVGVQEAFSKQWGSMMQALGSPFMQAAIPVMRQMTEMFERIADATNRNPENVKIIADAMIGLAGGLAAISAVSITKLIGLPGWLALLGITAYEVSPKFRELADTLGGNLKIALAGIYHACQDAWEGLSGLRDKLSGWGYDVARAVANALRAVGIPVPAITPWHDRMHPWLDRRGLTTLTPHQAMPGTPLPWDWKTRPDLFSTPPQLGTTTPVPPWMEGIPPGPPPSLKDWRNAVPSPAPAPSILPQRQSWEPSASGTVTVPVVNVIVLDGQKVAEVVNSHTAASMQFPRQAPMFDGRQNWSPPDAAAAVV